MYTVYLQNLNTHTIVDIKMEHALKNYGFVCVCVWCVCAPKQDLYGIIYYIMYT